MKTKQIKQYKAWLTPESMHNMSINWLSELRFVHDEQLFFNDLIKSYTLQLIDSKHFKESKEVIDYLIAYEKKTDKLIRLIVEHEKRLSILLNSINEQEEDNNYKIEHSFLESKVNVFLKDYKNFKLRLFKLIKGILKERKQKHLLQ
ncbi:hypothetical protein KFZ70_07125 [Tamlana fucoidanivorans]|uniref:Uncharacterized protein n=1 Tax=Allotamlana fucoidanivorans TaxID=2583814 RepID=A0A5C4SN62_9FLAO|nr:hypothetical protein [Tamlana fucoidanivorans]TNJ45221.1 hypothetical protein FGF67_05790 [Tamlana fucoidanivorans]